MGVSKVSDNDFETEVLLQNGLGTQYGLGVDVLTQSDRRALAHGGEVSGFTAQNIVFPDDGAAVVVLTNQDAARAAAEISRQISTLLFNSEDTAAVTRNEQARKIFEGLQHATIDRSLFTENANSYFNPQALQDFASGLAPLGAPQEFVLTRQVLRGGMTLRVYELKFAKQMLRVWTYEMPDGKLEQYQVASE